MRLKITLTKIKNTNDTLILTYIVCVCSCTYHILSTKILTLLGSGANRTQKQNTQHAHQLKEM